MSYSDTEKESILNNIFTKIENGNSLRKALLTIPLSSKTFYEWIEKDEEKVKQYARACEERAEAILDEMIDIVDDSSNDIIDVVSDEEAEALGMPLGGVMLGKTNNEAIQRSRLRYDARKWLVSKLNPKKYGDKVDLTTNGKELNPISAVQINRIVKK